MRSLLLASTISLAAVLFVAAPVRAGESTGADGYQMASAQVSRTVGEVYAFPNPARQVPTVTFHAEVGAASGVELLVFNAAGELVHQGQLSGDPSVIQGNSAYEYQWNLNNVASGSYFLVVRADQNGRSNTVARKAFTVIQ